MTKASNQTPTPAGKIPLGTSPDDLLGAVVARLLPRVEYTFVEMILSEVPGAATTELWAHRGRTDTPRPTRDRSTYGALERLLRRRELRARRLSASESAVELDRISQARRSLVDQLLGESTASNLPRRLSIRQVDPERRGPPSNPPLVARPALITEVWEAVNRQWYLLAREVLFAGAPPWGDPRIPYFDIDRFDRTCCEFFRSFLDPILRLPVGKRWRTRRTSSGWTVLTQYAVPRLYDYLRPFYTVRGYRDHRQKRPSGHYPAALRRDIRDLLRGRCPHVAANITLAMVTAAIQRHVRRADPHRLMGEEMFRLFPAPSPYSKLRKRPR